MTPRDFVEFSVSAFNQPSESVRRVAERLLTTLYHKHARLIRQNLPLEEDVSPKNIQYRHLFQQFDKIDREVSPAVHLIVLDRSLFAHVAVSSLRDDMAIPTTLPADCLLA